MEDITDPPFRRLCKEQGADVVYSEFINCEALVRNVTRAQEKLRICDEERPIGIQLYGSNEATMEEAARMATDVAPDFLDVNCGCWVKKIANRGEGAGLLRDLDKLEAVVCAVMRGTHLPVSVKTRLGWDENSVVIVELAPRLEALGVAALALHCRTRRQGYTGTADWSWLPKIKEASDIPLIANGDVTTAQDVATCLELGADGVMIGRGAIQKPWLFHQAKRFLATGGVLPDPPLEERIALCIRHLTEQAEYRGERRGVLTFRKHYVHYLKGVRNIAKLRKQLMEFEEVAPIVDLLRDFAEHYDPEAEA